MGCTVNQSLCDYFKAYTEKGECKSCNTHYTKGITKFYFQEMPEILVLTFSVFNHLGTKTGKPMFIDQSINLGSMLIQDEEAVDTNIDYDLQSFINCVNGDTLKES